MLRDARFYVIVQASDTHALESRHIVLHFLPRCSDATRDVSAEICKIKCCVAICNGLFIKRYNSSIFPPRIYVGVVAGLENGGDAISLTLVQNGFGAGIDRRGGDAALLDRCVLAEDAGQAARDGVNDCEGGHFPARETASPTANSLTGASVFRIFFALVDALIAAADEYDIRVLRERVRIFIRKLLPARRNQSSPLLFEGFRNPS